MSTEELKSALQTESAMGAYLQKACGTTLAYLGAACVAKDILALVEQERDQAVESWMRLRPENASIAAPTASKQRLDGYVQAFIAAGRPSYEAFGLARLIIEQIDKYDQS